MTDIGDWLRAADPLADRAPRSSEDVARLRATTMRAAVDQVNTRRTWPGASVVMATIVVVFAGTAWFEQRQPVAQHAAVTPAVNINRVPPVAGGVPLSAEVRQLHFATRGGTRIIWVFNPEFSLPGE